MAEGKLVMASQDQAPKAVGQEPTIQEIEQARDDPGCSDQNQGDRKGARRGKEKIMMI